MDTEDQKSTAQRGAASLALSPCSAWIACADQLPPLGQIVWLYAADDGAEKGPWIGSRDDPDNEGWLWGNAYGTMWWNGVRWDADVEQDDEYKPTHWMPLPTPPNSVDVPMRPDNH